VLRLIARGLSSPEIAEEAISVLADTVGPCG
jgi:hypothetical protein